MMGRLSIIVPPRERSFDLIYFEICGKSYKLSDYDLAVEQNKEDLVEYISILEEFPYSVRQLKGDSLAHIKEAPVFLVYRGDKISLHDFLSKCREFESQLPFAGEINGLERKYEFIVVFKGVQNNDSHAEIIESFRVLQDLHSTLAAARWALMHAHRILHFRSELVWSDGWEQLWTCAVWLNNAIMLYNSCFDKLIQTIWIGAGLYVGYQKKGDSKLDRNHLLTKEGLEQVYILCDYNKIKNRIPNELRQIIDSKYNNDFKKVRGFANRIKHRGGMRYIDLFPYGNQDVMGHEGYSPIKTQFKDDIDDVVESVKDYHIALKDLIIVVYKYLMNEFNICGVE